VENRVLELDYSSKEVVWKYTWYDERMENHEVHDADRLPGGGTAIADMGNDRAFVVNQSGAIVWEWQAENRLSRGTPFYEEYGGEPDPGGEADWTHLNDIDRLPDGDFQLSIRNFDVVIEVDRESKEITDVIGQPGNHSYLYEQHDPNRVAGGETILVADSENDRIVEIDTETGRVIWEFGGDGLLTWPRDADRLPNGNTLIADTQNDRVLEVNPGGEIVWRYRGADFLYSADRIGVSEDAGAYPSARGYEDRVVTDPVSGALRTLRSYAQFVVPPWMGSAEALTTLLLVLTGIGLVVESGREIRHRRT
jgi:outer membrane protein assembly factor BamB